MKILIVIPAYNEEKILRENILEVFNFCRANLKIDWQIVIADNNSSDRTSLIGRGLVGQYPKVDYLLVEKQGKGAAIRAGWQNFSADIYSFMDADLATDLSALPRLIEAISQGYDLVIGSRFHPRSEIKRSLTRKIFSSGYRLILKIFLKTKIKDAPCGFKAINSKIKANILPQVENNQWFFDSELVILAERSGYKIKEIPVIWNDPRKETDKSRVSPISLSLAYFKQVLVLRKRLSNINKF